MSLEDLLRSKKEELEGQVLGESVSDYKLSRIALIAPGRSLLLYDDKNGKFPEGHVLWLQDQNKLRVMDEMLFQLKNWGDSLQALQKKIAALKMHLEDIQINHAENLKKLTEHTPSVSPAIVVTSLLNDIEKIEKLHFSLDNVAKEGLEIMERNKEAINNCHALLGDPLLLEEDNTLIEKSRIITQSADTLKKEIASFNDEVTQKQFSPVAMIQADYCHEDDGSLGQDSIPEEYSYEDTEAQESVLEEYSFNYDTPLYKVESKMAEVKDLKKAKNLPEYIQDLLVLLKNPDSHYLLEQSINYKQKRVNIIQRLAYQLALSLVLGESYEKCFVLYQWIEICRGNPYRLRTLKAPYFDEAALSLIHQDPVLREIYFDIPRILRADLSPEAEKQAEETGIVNSVWSIDDLELTTDQILQQWIAFFKVESSHISFVNATHLSLQEEVNYREKRDINVVNNPSFSNQGRILVLIEQLIHNAKDTRLIGMRANIMRDLKIAYKLYELTKGTPSERRLLTKEPLTQEEYNNIKPRIHNEFNEFVSGFGEEKHEKLKMDPNYQHLNQKDMASGRFLHIFYGFDKNVQERIRLECYKSSILNTLAGDIANEDGFITVEGSFSHEKKHGDGFLIAKGEEEFSRGCRYLIAGDFLQYKLKYDAHEGLLGLLKSRGFTKSEARSILGFMREQMVYSIFNQFLAYWGSKVTANNYQVRTIPQYINIYKRENEVYFEVISGPWRFLRTEDPENPESLFPLQQDIGQSDNFYDAEFRIKYKLIPGKDLIHDCLQMVEVTTDSPISWQSLTFDSHEWERLAAAQNGDLDINKMVAVLWGRLPITRRCVLEIDKAIMALTDIDPAARAKAKENIETWLRSPNLLDIKDYELIQRHLRSILQVEPLVVVIGRDWFEAKIERLNTIVQCKKAVAELKDISTRDHAQQEINNFLVRFSEDRDLLEDLAKDLVQVKLDMQATESQGGLIDWVNKTILSIYPENAEQISSSSSSSGSENSVGNTPQPSGRGSRRHAVFFGKPPTFIDLENGNAKPNVSDPPSRSSSNSKGASALQNESVNQTPFTSLRRLASRFSRLG